MRLEPFNWVHLMLLGIEAALSVVFFIFVAKVKLSQLGKDRVLKSLAILTVVLHVSVLWWGLFKDKKAPEFSIYFMLPVAFCNVALLFNLITICLLNYRHTRAFKIIAEFAAWGGIFGGLITIIYGGSSVLDWGCLKSFLSHWVMFLASTYMFIGGYAKIRVRNLFPLALGFALNGIMGAVTNWVTDLSGIPDQNAMWLREELIPGEVWTSPYLITLYIFILVFAFTAIWERFAIKDKNDRWHGVIKRAFNKNKNLS